MALAFAFRSSRHDLVQQPCAGPLTDLPDGPLGRPLFHLAKLLLRKRRHNIGHGFATGSPPVAAGRLGSWGGSNCRGNGICSCRHSRRSGCRDNGSCSSRHSRGQRLYHAQGRQKSRKGRHDKALLLRMQEGKHGGGRETCRLGGSCSSRHNLKGCCRWPWLVSCCRHWLGCCRCRLGCCRCNWRRRLRRRSRGGWRLRRGSRSSCRGGSPGRGHRDSLPQHRACCCSRCCFGVVKNVVGGPRARLSGS